MINGCCQYLTTQLSGSHPSNQSSPVLVRWGSDSRIVLDELSAMETPQLVRNWATNLPEWIEVLSATPTNFLFTFLEQL